MLSVKDPTELLFKMCVLEALVNSKCGFPTPALRWYLGLLAQKFLGVSDLDLQVV
jgi:hypothetical protein